MKLRTFRSFAFVSAIVSGLFLKGVTNSAPSFKTFISLGLHQKLSIDLDNCSFLQELNHPVLRQSPAAYLKGEAACEPWEFLMWGQTSYDHKAVPWGITDLLSGGRWWGGSQRLFSPPIPYKQFSCQTEEFPSSKPQGYKAIPILKVILQPVVIIQQHPILCQKAENYKVIKAGKAL